MHCAKSSRDDRPSRPMPEGAPSQPIDHGPFPGTPFTSIPSALNGLLLLIETKRVILVVALLFFCYLPVHAQWRSGFYYLVDGALPQSEIPWSDYTHIIAVGAYPGVDGSNKGNGSVSSTGYFTPADSEKILTGRPLGKKLLVSLVDNHRNLNAFSQSTAPGVIGTFVTNIVAFVNTNRYDGIDLDWEVNRNIAQYSDLITRLRAAMPWATITIDVADPALKTLASANQFLLDQINIMCYDMDWSGGLGFSWYNGAIVNGNTVKDPPMETCSTRTNPFLAAGVVPGKIGIGIPFYGRRWSGVQQALVNGSFTPSTFPYNQLVTDATRWLPQYKHYDSRYKSNYLSVPWLNEFDSYNGVEAIRDTAAWIKSQGFGGAMTFDLQYEYLSGATGDARYPLSTALYDAMVGRTAPIVITTSPLPAGMAETSYSAVLAASGSAPIMWTVTSGTLPPGLSLDPTSGNISGTPTSAKTFTFVVQASNSVGSSPRTVSLVINPAAAAPVITTKTPLPLAIRGKPYSATLGATGSNPIAWSISGGALPAGLSLSSTSGVISSASAAGSYTSITGTPTLSGTFIFTVNASNSFGSSHTVVQVTVN